jgi:hypothetical protein
MTRQIALPPTLPPRLIGREAAAAYICVSPNSLMRWSRTAQCRDQSNCEGAALPGMFVALTRLLIACRQMVKIR